MYTRVYNSRVLPQFWSKFSACLQRLEPSHFCQQILILSSDHHKCMLMLSAFLDETGHSSDKAQRFNGMAGLMAPTKRLLRMERKWNRTLSRFRLPFFHMKDFASFRGPYKGWTEQKRRDLYRRLLAHITGAQPFLVGSILAMEDFRSLTAKQQADFVDPYHIGFMLVTGYLATAANAIQPPDEKVALVFSDQVEFRNDALKIYEAVTAKIELVRRRTDWPIFRDMKKFVALQAADIVAYELYKEYERQLDRPDKPQRHGYKAFCEMSRKLGLLEPMFAFQTKASLNIGGKCESPRWAGEQPNSPLRFGIE